MKTAKLPILAALCLAFVAQPALAQIIVPLVPAKPEPKKPEEAKTPGKRAQKPKKKKKPAVELPREKPQATQVALRGPVVPLKPGESTTIHVKILDQLSQPYSARFKLTADRGTITAPVAMNPGQYLATYAAPSNAEPGGSAKIRAEVREGPKPVIGELTIGFAGSAPTPIVSLVAPAGGDRPEARPARVFFKEQVEVRAGQTALLKFRVLDSDDQPMPLSGVELKADGGTLSEPEEILGGYLVRYLPDADHSGEVRVRAEARGRPLDGEGLVIVKGSGLSGRGERLGLDLSAFAGGLTNFGAVASPQFELALAYALSNLRLGVLGGFSPAGAEQVTELAGSRQASFSFTIIPIVARAGMNWVLGPIDVSAGGMAGLALVSAEVDAAGVTESFSEKLLDLGLYAGAGLPLGPGAAVLELRMTHIKLDHQDPRINVKGQLGGLSGALGYRLEL
ncbi:MAG TPA: hypothetical protein DFS52_27030 [Myxococcales bacterium]|nr:hypothetical protein [Myxococcales bacterium]